MQRVKLFKGLEDDVEFLEKKVNEWAESEGVKILQISSYNPSAKTGSSLQTNVTASSDILVTVLYEKN